MGFLGKMFGFDSEKANINPETFDPHRFMTSEEKSYRDWLRESFRSRAERTGPTALEEALRERAMEGIAQQRRQGQQQLEQALAKRGIQSSGVVGQGVQDISSQALNQQAKRETQLEQLAARRQQQALANALGMSGQALQASGRGAQSYGGAQAKADIAAAESQNRAARQFGGMLTKGLGTYGLYAGGVPMG